MGGAVDHVRLPIGAFKGMTMRVTRLAGIMILAGGLAGCERSDVRESASGAGPPAVDSVVPRQVALHRFRSGLSPTQRLDGGESSPEALIHAYARALEARDTAALARVAISRAEFAYLFYPTTPQGLPPYDVEPGLLWSLLTSRSDRGVRRALAVYGGQPLHVVGFDCGAHGSREGENTIWGPCMVRWRDEHGDTVSKRMLSQLIEREGHYKVLSYGNGL